MKKLLPTLMLTTLCVLPQLSHAQGGEVRLSNESKLSINGKSNVNEFSCRSKHELQQYSLDFTYSAQKDTVTVSGASLALEIDQFDCGKRAINRDFRSTLKYKEHPFIEIMLNELVLEDSSDIVPQEAMVTIRIAGVEQNYAVPLHSFSSRENQFLVSGNKILYMTDFGLNPPSPMFGLIKVDNELNIEFDLVIRRQP